MPRKSVKADKNAYFLRREELGLTREQAAELLDSIPVDTLEKIENERRKPYPEEVLRIAEAYKCAELCNYFCHCQCDVGKKYVPEIKVEHLSKIILKMLASLNSVQEKQARLIEITNDGTIADNEIKDFVDIQEKLERISQTVEALQLWAENKLANNLINVKKYEAIKSAHKR